MCPNTSIAALQQSPRSQTCVITSQCDLHWRLGLRRDNQFKDRSLGWAPTQYGWCITRGHLDTDQFSSVAQTCPTLCHPMNHSTPGLLVYHQLPEFTQTHIHWVSDAIQPSHPLSSPSPPAPSPSQHQSLFQWVNSSHEVAKVLEFQLQHQSFQWTPTTDLPKMDWLNLLAVQGTLKSLLQHHSSKASIFQRSAFFTVQLSHPYMATGKGYSGYYFITLWYFSILVWPGHISPILSLSCSVVSDSLWHMDYSHQVPLSSLTTIILIIFSKYLLPTFFL